MKSQNQITKKWIFGALILVALCFGNKGLDSQSFDKSYTLDIELIMDATFDKTEAAYMDADQEELFGQLLKSIEKNPELLYELPPELKREILKLKKAPPSEQWI